MRDNGAVDVVGLGASSRGIRKGWSSSLDATVEAVKAAVSEAELMAGVDVQSATVKRAATSAPSTAAASSP